MATKPKALIVGAGIAGLSAAWWLDKAGWESTIIERASSIREGGYIVSVSGIGLETVQRMGLQKMLDCVTYQCDVNLVRDNKGRELARIRYEDVHGGYENLALGRGDLAHTLAKGLPESAKIRFSETVKDIVDDGTKVSATLSSGETIEGDLLIGADGIRSSVRDKVWKDIDCLEHLGYSYAVYDIDGASKLQCSCVSFNSPGHLDVLYSLRDDQMAALHIWRDDQAKLQERELRFGIIRGVTKGGAQMISDVIDRAEAAGASPVIDSVTMVTLPQWSKGRVLLLGDAAHCLTLISGQGAAMALASAEVLGKELMETKDVVQALGNHEKKMRPIIERLQGRSRRMAAMYIPKSKWVYYLRNIVIRLLPASWVARLHSNSVKLEIDLTKN